MFSQLHLQGLAVVDFNAVTKKPGQWIIMQKKLQCPLGESTGQINV
jgi:hypothetical protein